MPHGGPHTLAGEFVNRRTGEPGTNKIYTPHSHFCGYLIG